MQPGLYSRLDRQAAIAAFGDESKARVLSEGQWVIWEDAAICFAELGEPPLQSHFRNGADFAWVGRISDDPSDWNRSVLGGPESGRSIWLFVRAQRGDDYCFVGQLRAMHTEVMHGNHPIGLACFGLQPTLPADIWKQLDGYDPGDLDFSGVDAALALLAAPTTMSERLEVLKTIVRFFHGELPEDAGFSEAELGCFTMPAVLNWWYRFAGHREEILSGQNVLLKPSQLQTRDGMLVFYGENQWCYEWATAIEGDDPPVFGRSDSSEPWAAEGITLSEHLILCCLFEAIMVHCPYGACTACLDIELVLRLMDQIPPVPVRGWNWCGTRFFAGGGAFMFVAENGPDDCSVWIGAKTEQPLEFLRPMVDETWDYVAV